MSVSFESVSSPGSVLLAAEAEGESSACGAILLFENHPSSQRSGLVAVSQLREELASRLHRVPLLRRRVVRSPILRRCFWVDDERFEPSAHIRHVRLARRLGERGLKDVAGELLSCPLDPDRPLWELWVVDGFEEKRFALVAKLHPCVSGSLSAARVLGELLDRSPRAGACDEPLPWLPEPAPGRLRLALEDLVHPVSAWPPVVSGTAVRWPSARRTMGLAGPRVSGLAARARAWLGPAGLLPFDPRGGPIRRIEWLGTTLDEVERASRALGGSPEGLSLAAIAGALRRSRFRTGLCRDAHEAWVLFAADRGDSNGAPAGWDRVQSVCLPLDEADPETRLARVEASVRRCSEERSQSHPSRLVPRALAAAPTLWRLAVRALASRPGFDLLVTDASVAPSPLYLGEASLRAVFPVPPRLPGVGLAIGLFSYAGTLSWGFSATPEAVSDLCGFVFGVAVGFCELLERAEALAGASVAEARTGS